MPEYNIHETHFSDLYGRFLWSEPLTEENRLYRIGEKVVYNLRRYEVVRIAIVDNTQHVNLKWLKEDVAESEPPHFGGIEDDERG